MGKADDIDLMLLADGELAPDKAREIAAVLAADEQAQAKTEAVRQIGELVRGRLELAADDVAPQLDSLWSAIDSAISTSTSTEQSSTEQSTTAAPATEAIIVGREPRQPRKGAAPERGLLDGVREWMDRWRASLLTGAACAAAASLLFMAVQQPKRDFGEVAQQTVPAEQDDTPPPSTSAAQETLVAQPPVVESLEVTGGSGTVLSIPGEEGENPTTVIWVTADDIMEEPI